MNMCCCFFSVLRSCSGYHSHRVVLDKKSHALALLCEARSVSSEAAFLLPPPKEARNLSASMEVLSSLKASVADRGLVKSIKTGLGEKIMLQ